MFPQGGQRSGPAPDYESDPEFQQMYQEELARLRSVRGASETLGGPPPGQGPEAPGQMPQQPSYPPMESFFPQAAPPMEASAIRARREHPWMSAIAEGLSPGIIGRTGAERDREAMFGYENQWRQAERKMRIGAAYAKMTAPPKATSAKPSVLEKIIGMAQQITPEVRGYLKSHFHMTDEEIDRLPLTLARIKPSDQGKEDFTDEQIDEIEVIAEQQNDPDLTNFVRFQRVIRMLPPERRAGATKAYRPFYTGHLPAEPRPQRETMSPGTELTYMKDLRGMEEQIEAAQRAVANAARSEQEVVRSYGTPDNPDTLTPGTVGTGKIPLIYSEGEEGGRPLYGPPEGGKHYGHIPRDTLSREEAMTFAGNRKARAETDVKRVAGEIVQRLQTFISIWVEDRMRTEGVSTSEATRQFIALNPWVGPALKRAKKALGEP